MPESPGILDNLRVLDLSEGIAGPYCTKLLSGLGADVLKVERPGSGDPARSWPPFYQGEPGLERSGLFLYLNTDKRSITLDLENPAGQAVFRRLVVNADLVVESFPPGTLATWGLDYPSLERISPRLILTSVTPFGQDGPYRDYESSDLVLSALGGLLYITGDTNREPLKIGGQPAQYFAGVSAFTGSMFAYFHLLATGEGQQVDVSGMDGIALAQCYSSINYAYRKTNRARVEEVAPQFKAKDGYIGLMYRQSNWEDLCHLMGQPDLTNDPRFSDNVSRRIHLDELNAIVGNWIKEQPKEDLYHTMQAMRMPTGYICDAKDLLASPQYAARNFWVEIDHPLTGPLTYPGLPFQIADTSTEFGRAPLLGEHNEMVYHNQLGYSEEQLSLLRHQGII